MAGITDKYKKWCKTEGAPSAENNKATEYDSAGVSGKFQDVLSLNAFQYTGIGGITAVRTEAGSHVDSTEAHKKVWTTIATEIVNRYHGDRTGKAIPKGEGGANFNVGIPPVGYIAPGPSGAGVLNGDKKFGDTVDLIVNWFEANWAEGQKDAKSTSSTSRESGVKCAAVTAGGASTEAKAVQEKFAKYWTKREFGVGGGVALPAALVPTDTTMKFFPNLAPHKDAELKQEESDTTTRKGAIGFCIGPVNRGVEPTLTEEVTTIRDGNTVYDKVPVYELKGAPVDTNKYLMDEQLYLSQLKNISGYADFRTLVPEFTGLPIDGKEMKIPIFAEKAADIQFDADGKPIPLREESASPKAYNLGLKGGKLGQGLGYTTAVDNPGYGNKIDDPAYGAVICTKFPINQSNDHGIVSQWMATAGTQVLGGNTIGDAWGAGSGGGGNFPAAFIKFWQPNIKAFNPENNLSYSDPRNWGPYTENTKFTKGDASVGDGGSATVDGKSVTYTVKWKYVIPDLTAMKAAANDGGGNSGIPGIPAHGTEACYPEMNKQYWGLRLEEVYPPPLNAFEESKKKPSGGANAAVVNGTGGVKKGAYYAAGPAPPMTIKESGSPAMSATFKFSNENFFKGDPTKATSQKSFTRERPQVDKSWIQSWPNYMAKVIDYDKKVKGTANGGMTYFDAAKQIIPPYAPPPLKPMMPNQKKFKFKGMLNA